MKTFREWFKDRYGFKYPAMRGEHTHDVMQRIADSFADYVEEVASYQKEKPPSS